MNWLRAVNAFRSFPAPKTPVMRDTRISPRSASTRTSANWAPNEYIEKVLASAFSPVDASSSIHGWPFQPPLPIESSRDLSAAAALYTADPVVAAVCDPPDTGVSG